MDNLLNVNQVAFILKVHPLTIRRYLKEGKLKAVRLGGNIRIKESQLQDFHKDFSPNASLPKITKNKQLEIKTFSIDDPLFQLKGRIAILNS